MCFPPGVFVCVLNFPPTAELPKVSCFPQWGGRVVILLGCFLVYLSSGNALRGSHLSITSVDAT